MGEWFFIDNKNNKQDNLEELDLEKDINQVFNNSSREIVLCVGKVQSGKTRKILKCIEHAIYNLDYDIVILFGGTTNYLYKQTKRRLKEYFNNEINYNYYPEIIEKDYLSNKLIKNKKYIINALKPNNIEDIIFLLNNTYDISEKKILIIDDEADYASINISNTNSGSSTYQNLSKLYEKVKKGKILQVTATPFANIISRCSNNTYPDRVVCWSNYKEYKGLVEFNENRKNNYVVINGAKDDIKSYKENIENVVEYFISTVINNHNIFISEINNNEYSCLFNIDLDIKIHEKIKNIIANMLDKISNFKDEFYSKCIDKKIDKNTYHKLINSVLKNSEIIILNSNSKTIDKGIYNFYVGGTLISRGNTFENLIAELIINSPKNAAISVDTLLQRCRWFGNRTKIMPFIKIYMNSDIYESLLESEKYVNLLTIGEHDVNDLFREITILDQSSKYVKSTSKE